MCFSGNVDFTNFPDIPLRRILSFLDKTGLLSTRQVCRHWNEVTLDLFPDSVSIKVSTLEQKRTTGMIEFYKDFDPRIFRRIVHSYSPVSNYHHQSTEEASQNINIGPFLDTMQNLNISDFIVQVHITGTEALDCLARFVNEHGLPNLKKLSVYLHRREIEYQPSSRFNLGSLPKLERLHNVSVPLEDDSSVRELVQSLINASPNLTSINLNTYFDLSRNRKIRKMCLSYTHDSEDSDPIYDMLDGVRDSITVLKVLGHPFEGLFPVMPNLKYFQLMHMKPVNQPCEDLAISVPNLEVLKTSCYKGYDSSLKELLASKPKTLRKVEIECCPYLPWEGHVFCQQICSDAIAVSNLRVLKVSGSCVFLNTDEGLLDFLVNLDFTHVIFQERGGKGGFRQLLKGLRRVNVEGKLKSRGTLEFTYITMKGKGYEILAEELMESFPSSFMKLAKRWSRIVITGLNLSPSSMQYLQQKITGFKLPVELRCAYGM